jgi:hypothetical protein
VFQGQIGGSDSNGINPDNGELYLIIIITVYISHPPSAPILLLLPHLVALFFFIIAHALLISPGSKANLA